MVIVIIKQIVLGLSLAAPVGPINIEMIKRGMFQGFWSSWLIGIGAMTADFLFMLLVYLGFGRFLLEPLIQLLMYSFGFVFLTYLAMVTFQSAKIKSTFQEDFSRTSFGQSFRVGFFIALANPINIVFWFGVYGSALSEIASQVEVTKALLYSLCIFIGIILWNLNIAFTSHFSRNICSQRWMEKMIYCAGILLLGYGIYFGYNAFLLLIEIRASL
ncbi:LysE family transporter [Bacillus taeanensis]|uniref:Amino acid transporter n=1 Tax=Bacillus taeanensis TaxID=273032 RepID=A0A366Y0W1_9BACI|nr:LysE family transporter [Bacillus taeanensis]RBW71005.1 amino acid transporter [Bacillus taeanensis]